jgi:hypothetical protein
MGRFEGATTVTTFDVRTWALHDAVFQLGRELGLDSFRVECKLGPGGETVVSLVVGGKGDERRGSRNRVPGR